MIGLPIQRGPVVYPVKLSDQVVHMSMYLGTQVAALGN